MSKRNNLFQAFRVAFLGIYSFFTTERNGKIQLLVSLFVIVLAFVFNISAGEWISVLLAIAIVFAAEMVNTTIEKVCDLITTEYHPSIKTIKDISAGMVLLAAIISVIIGGIIFLPKLGFN